MTRLQDVETVRLFLEHGADVNLKHGRLMEGLPLLTAVEKRKGNQELAEILVQRTDRVPCTRALGRAIQQWDTSIVNILLASGVKCDFEDSDRPAIYRPSDFESWLNTETENPSEPNEYLPPLIRAILLPDVHLVQLLLDHGADIDLPLPLWQHHHCEMISRTAYHEIIAQLRSAAVEKTVLV